MMKRFMTTANGRRLGTGVALLGVVWLASCQPETVTANKAARPDSHITSDSLHVQDDDPPVGPSGPGGGK
ncbi:hypothetical protein [Spirosoma migulaei]